MVKFAQLPKYEAYKDSEFPWVGMIPCEWEVSTLGNCLFPVSIKNYPDYPLLSITRELGVIERDIEDTNSNHNFIPDDLTGYKLLRQGQFGMNKMKAWQGSYGVSKFTGIVSPAYFVFEFTKSINPDYFNWAIRSQLYISYFGSASDGVRIGQWDLSKSRMKGIPFLLPSEQEQTLIANFLDQKTAQIDAAIAIKEQQIELLKERKQIIIQQAVTQGLDPNVPMKDSGVEWIGQIPEHWEVIKLKLLTNKIVDGAHFTPTYVDQGVPFLRVTDLTNMINGKINWEAVRYIPENEHKELIKRAKPEIGDVLLSKNGTIGLTKVIDWNEEFSIFVSLCLIKLKNSLRPEYFTAFFNSPIVDLQITFGSSRTSVTNLHLEKIKELLVILPPIEDQLKIVSYINQVSESYDPLIDVKLNQIQKLKEYKTTLINSAVTGKIKITPEMLQA
ncbi:restriction endonuclease subunit S [Thiopseudomonas alkaliphila]|uniref:Restriction endonuclease subunit S n=1 Tax=Thiopseudomonas alkaliphila TaxID=1697053 RepID=A0AAW7DWZ5_9GAMM|nr:restriction endonuclease subunit S [Thiopseudomonas alkaliphila]MDM1697226.1 restriction endonuclease subunit S [Thiopseudomonas alkaliphila]